MFLIAYCFIHYVSVLNQYSLVINIVEWECDIFLENWLFTILHVVPHLLALV